MGDKIKKVVKIVAHEDKPLKIELLKRSLPEKVYYELRTLEKGRVFEIILKNKWEKKGKYSGLLTFKTNYQEKPEITIRFLGFIRGSLKVAPAIINFRQFDKSAKNSPEQKNLSVRRSVMITLNRGNNLEINKVEINRDVFRTDIKEIRKGKSFRIDVHMNPQKIGNGLTKEKMKIYTSLKDEPVVIVPIRLQKRIKRISNQD